MITLEKAQEEIGYGPLRDNLSVNKSDRTMWMCTSVNPILKQFDDQPLNHAMLKNQAQARLDDTPYTNRTFD